MTENNNTQQPNDESVAELLTKTSRADALKGSAFGVVGLAAVVYIAARAGTRAGMARHIKVGRELVELSGQFATASGQYLEQVRQETEMSRAAVKALTKAVKKA